MKKVTASPDKKDIVYLAEMIHSESSICRLATVHYDLFQIWRKLLLIAVGVFMILFGVMADLPLQAAGIIVFFGCLCLWFCKVPAQITANRMIAAIDGAYPHTMLYFFRDRVEITDGSNWFYMLYQLIQRVVQDDTYIYLFLNTSTSYMIDKSTVKPSDLSGFQRFLEAHTGLLTETPPTLFRLNIAALIRRVKNAKTIKHRKPRKTPDQK